MHHPVLIAGTRTSTLARWQTGHVADVLQRTHPGLRLDIQPYSTSGDLALDAPLPSIGGKGAFTAELEQALRERRIDIAVHSLKDLPVTSDDDLTVAAILPRADARDAVVARDEHTLATLPVGAVVGTSSLRRAAQIQRLRPDLTIRSIRGNVETRIRKVMHDRAYDATILALAGLDRLGLLGSITEELSFETMLPAPGQGALAVQCRADDYKTIAFLRAIDDEKTHAETTAERAFLHYLEAGCSAPVAAYARSDGHMLSMQGLVSSVDGTNTIAVAGRSSDPLLLGSGLAAEARSAGAEAILAHARTLT